MSYIYLESAIEPDRLASAVEQVTGVRSDQLDIAELFTPGRDLTKLLVSTTSNQSGDFRHSVKVGSKLHRFDMPGREFGPKMASALGVRVLYDDDLDEGDSDYLPAYVVDPDGTVHRADINDDGKVTIH